MPYGFLRTWHRLLFLFYSNLLPHRGLPLGTTPLTRWNPCRPLSIGRFLRCFGCLCYYLLPAPRGNKFAPTSQRGIFLGFGMQTLGYLILDIDSRKLIHSRNVKFDEDTPGVPFLTHTAPPSSSSNDTYLSDDYGMKAPMIVRPHVYPEPHPIDPTLPVYGPHHPRGRPPGTTAAVMAQRRRRAEDARLTHVTIPTNVANCDFPPHTLL